MNPPTEEQIRRWEESVPEGFPTFSSDAFSFLRDDEARDARDDTLYSDTAGDGVEFAYALFDSGLRPFFDCPGTDPEQEWNSTPWGHDALFTIEAIAASGGQPSSHPELAALRRWGAEVDFEPPSDLVDAMIEVIDFIIGRYREDQEKSGRAPESLEGALAAGALMRERVLALKKSG